MVRLTNKKSSELILQHLQMASMTHPLRRANKQRLPLAALHQMPRLTRPIGSQAVLSQPDRQTATQTDSRMPSAGQMASRP